LLAVAAADLVAFLLIVLRPGRGGLEAWLPFLGYLGTGTAGWFTNITSRLYLDPWLLGGVLIGELIMFVAAGAVSPAALRQAAQIEPINRIAIPLAVRLPWMRWRIFRDYVEGIRAQLERDRRQANDEKYMAVPAKVFARNNPGGTTDVAPATAILRFLSAEQGHVLVEAPGGRGKSALLREVVYAAADEFEKDPGSKPVPVLLAGVGKTIEEMAETSLASALISPQLLALHLEAGDLLLVLDGASESGLPEEVVNKFVRGLYGAQTSLVLGSRPVREYRHVLEGRGLPIGWLRSLSGLMRRCWGNS
jgi:hypothetical protein